MSPRRRDIRPLEGPGSEKRLADLRRGFQAAQRRNARRARLRNLGWKLLIGYWIACLAVIGVGLNSMYPNLWPGVQRALPGLDIDQPFPNCSAAHDAGVYDIPWWSPGYTPKQDGDGDGWSCEPPRGLY